MPPGERMPLQVGIRFATRGDANAPAAIGNVAVERTGQAEHDPDVAVSVELGTECVLVIVAGDLPAIVDDLKFIRLAVTVGVSHSRHVAIAASCKASRLARPVSAARASHEQIVGIEKR